MADYYAATNGTAGGAGTLVSPWDLKTALVNASQTSDDTLWLRGGTYPQKAVSLLDGGSVRSYCYQLYGYYDASEYATVDGNATTTLAENINSSVTEFDLASTATFAMQGAFDSTDIVIDSELIRVYSISGNTVTSCDRGFGGTTAASHTNGATVRVSGTTFIANGDNTTYRDFRVTNSYTLRDAGAAWNVLIPTLLRGSGIYPGNNTTGNKFVNLVVDNHVDGMGSAPTSSNSELYGNLMTNNGVHYDGPPEQGAGNGFYGGNGSGYFRFYDNISLNNFGFNGQFGDMQGGDFQDNVFANAGSPLGGLRDPLIGNFNVLYHHEETDTSMTVTDSHHWMSYENTALAAWFGYGGLISNVTATGNTFVGGDWIVKFAGNGTNITTVVDFSDNILYGPNSGTYINKLASFAVTAQDNNTYYDADGLSVFSYNGSGVNFASWKSSTGYDASSSQTSTAMPDTVDVIPNIYEIGRAHIVVYGISSPTSINVNLATTGLTDGQSYEIRNAFDFFGDAVATGTYDAGSTTISLPLNGAALDVATPVGMAYTPATTVPLFGVFIVIPLAATAGAPGAPTGLSVNLRQSDGATGGFALVWTLNGAAETSVTVRRISTAGTVDTVLGADVTSYSPTGLTIGETYTFAVKASNASGDSEWSSTVQKVLTGLHYFGAPPAIAN